MATEGSPIITESTTPTNNPLPKVPSLSPNTSSSPGSSRPASQASSRTSYSVSSSPIPKSIPTTDSDDSLEIAALPSNPPRPEDTSVSPSQRHDEIPRSVPPASDATPMRNHEAAWLSRLACLVPTGQWFVNTMGVLTFGLTLIGMIVFGRLTIWQAWNEAATTCAQFVSVSRSRLATNLLVSAVFNNSIGRYKNWSELPRNASVECYGRRDFTLLQELEASIESKV